MSTRLQENKTSNVNVLATDDTEMNNELSFDSEKFSKHEKLRPEETIDNLSSQNQLKKRGMVKSTNLLKDEDHRCGGDVASVADFNGIKRIRLDSSDTASVTKAILVGPVANFCLFAGEERANRVGAAARVSPGRGGGRGRYARA